MVRTMMTEDEAKLRWCPFARDSETSGNRLRYGGYGESVDPQYGAKAAGEFPCIASACMAWRWTDPANDTQYTAEGVPAQGPEWVRGPDKIVVKWDRPRLGRAGFCGLAGAPE